MSADKPLAPVLADNMHISSRIGWRRQAAAELRRLHAINAALIEALERIADPRADSGVSGIVAADAIKQAKEARNG